MQPLGPALAAHAGHSGQWAPGAEAGAEEGAVSL